MSLGGLFDDIFRLFAAALPKCLILQLGGVAVLEIYLTLLRHGADPKQPLSISAGSSALFLYVLIPFLLSWPVWLALLARVNHVATGSRRSSLQALGAGLRLTPRSLLAALYYTVLVLVGLVSLIVPGLFLLVSLGFSQTAIVVDGATAVRSLKMSRALTRKRWWRSAPVLLMPLLVNSYAMVQIVVFALLLSSWPTGMERTVADAVISALALVATLLPALIDGVSKVGLLPQGLMGAVVLASTGMQSTETVNEALTLAAGVVVSTLNAAALISVYHDLKRRDASDALTQRAA